MRGRKKWLALFLAVVMCLGAVYSEAFVWQTEAATGTGKTMEASEIDSYGSQLTAEQKAVYDKLVDYYMGADGFADKKNGRHGIPRKWRIGVWHNRRSRK